MCVNMYCRFVVVILSIRVMCESCQVSDKNLTQTFRNAALKFGMTYFNISSLEVSSKAKLYLQRDTLGFVISPLLLHLTLMTLSLGASRKTLQELDNAMFLSITKEEKERIIRHYNKKLFKSGNDIKLHAVNMMFVDDTIGMNDKYLQTAKHVFNMTIDRIDFNNPEAMNQVNNLISKYCRYKMNDIFDETDFTPSSTSMVLVNSVYYKNKWRYPPTVLNHTYPFKRADLPSQNYTNVKMFRINGIMNYADDAGINAQIIEIPYMTEDMSMIVFLPRTMHDLLPMESRIMKENNIFNYLKSKFVSMPVAISIPRFSLETSALLPSKLKSMGIKRILEKNAEFDGMVMNSGPFVSHGVQRVKLWGDQGRGAFKDTGDEEYPKPGVVIFADRPFFFIIKIMNMSLMMGHFLV